MLKKLSITDIDPWEMEVFLRVDFNVPLDEKLQVQDDFRIVSALKTIKYLLDKKAAVILCSHLGRPKGKKVPEMSLKPVANRLSDLLGMEVKMAPDCIGEQVSEMALDLKYGEVMMLENVRYHKEETDNDPGFSQQLASLADIYINDAFGAAHRAHASVEGITKYFDIRAAGFLMQKEMDYLIDALQAPEKPFYSILGGAKVSSKIDLIQHLLDKCDKILLGGAMVCTFLKSLGIKVGSSLVEEDKIDTAKDLMKIAEQRGVEMLLPKDHLVADSLEDDAETRVVGFDQIPSGWHRVDIGPETIKHYSELIKEAKTIVWNGPVGIFEKDAFARGTIELAHAVAESGAISIIGGGDSAAAIAKAGVADKMTHISTGGGASLELLAGKELPGIVSLTDK